MYNSFHRKYKSIMPLTKLGTKINSHFSDHHSGSHPEKNSDKENCLWVYLFSVPHIRITAEIRSKFTWRTTLDGRSGEIWVARLMGLQGRKLVSPSTSAAGGGALRYPPTFSLFLLHNALPPLKHVLYVLDFLWCCWGHLTALSRNKEAT